MQGDWDKLGKDFADTPNVVIGMLDCSGAAQSFCGQHSVRGYPTLKILKGGKSEDYNGAREYSALKRTVESKLNPRPACSLESKDACPKRDLAILEESEAMSKADRSAKLKQVETEIKEKKEKAKELEKEAKQLTADLDLIKAGGLKVEKAEQLLEDADMRAHCEGRTCIIAFLPHILDDFAKGRNANIKMLNEALLATKKEGKDIGYLWSEGGAQFDMEESMGLSFGFPAMVAINFKKNVYGGYKGSSFTKDAITQFVTSLGRGGVPLAPIPANAKVVKQKPWDGKDGEAPVEEEL